MKLDLANFIKEGIIATASQYENTTCEVDILPTPESEDCFLNVILRTSTQNLGLSESSKFMLSSDFKGMVSIDIPEYMSFNITFNISYSVIHDIATIDLVIS